MVQFVQARLPVHALHNNHYSMKKIFIMFIIALAGGLSSCEGDTTNTIRYNFYFAENPVMVGASSGTAQATIISDIDYTPVSVDSWITDVVKTSAGSVSFKVDANTLQTSRDGMIAFHIAGTKDVLNLTVRQAASTSGLSADIEELTFATAGEEKTIKVNATSNWTIGSHPDWVTAEKKNAAALSLTAEPNFEGETRSGDLVIKTTSEELTIRLNQESKNELFKNATTKLGRRFAFNCGNLITRVVTDKNYTVVDGVEALEMKYMSNHTGKELPYSIYVYEVDLNKNVTILATCKDDDASNIKKTDSELTGCQNMIKQLAAMKSNRKERTVYGGINGDFCYGTGSSVKRNALLHGVMHKDGICLKSTFDGGAVCTVFAMMNDGKARILQQSNYNSYKNSIVEAIGGRQTILDAGVITSVKNNLNEPRTAIGVSADRSKVIMLVVDGRQPSHSNGADYPEMGIMFKAMGAYNAINLDGGGSSTFVLQSASASDGFAAKNSPSDKSPRAIPNGLAIVSK